MASEGEVVHVQVVGCSDRGRRLSEGEVRGAGMLVGDILVLALELDFVDDCLEVVADQHVVVNRQEIILGVVLLLLGDGLVVLADGDVLEGNLARLEPVLRANL